MIEISGSVPFRHGAPHHKFTPTKTALKLSIGSYPCEAAACSMRSRISVTGTVNTPASPRS